MDHAARLRRILLIALAVLLVPVGPLFADLGDFADAVEESRDAEGNTDDGKSDDWDDDDGDSDGFFDFLMTFTFLIWYYHNGSTFYAAYPYEAPGRPAVLAHDPLLVASESPPDRKRSRGAAFASGGLFFETPDRGSTASLRLSGMLGGVFEPEVEYRWWADSSGQLHLLKAGGRIPLFQTDYLSMDMALGAAFFFDLLEVGGLSVGGGARIYPFRPVSLEIRGGAIVGESVEIGELAVKLGWHMNRLEFFTAYHGLDPGSDAVHAVDAGIGIHF